MIINSMLRYRICTNRVNSKNVNRKVQLLASKNFKCDELCNINDWTTKQDTVHRRNTTSLICWNNTYSRSFSSISRSSHASLDPAISQPNNLDMINTTTDLVASSSGTELIWYYPSHWVITAVQSLHEITGCSYSITMAGLTIAFRIAIFPIALRMRKRTYYADRSTQNKDEGNDKKTLLSTLRSDMKKRKKLNSMFNSKESFINIASMVTVLFGLNSMTYYYPTELASGGTLWFTDLTQLDPTFFLPILSWCTFIIMGEMGADMFGNVEKESSTLRRNFFRTLYAVMFVPIMTLPSAVFCYWIPNNIFSLGQIIVFTDPTCLKYLGMSQATACKVYARNKSSTKMANKKLLQPQITSSKQKNKRFNKKKKR